MHFLILIRRKALKDNLIYCGKHLWITSAHAVLILLSSFSLINSRKVTRTTENIVHSKNVKNMEI